VQPNEPAGGANPRSPLQESVSNEEQRQARRAKK